MSKCRDNLPKVQEAEGGFQFSCAMPELCVNLCLHFLLKLLSCSYFKSGHEFWVLLDVWSVVSMAGLIAPVDFSQRDETVQGKALQVTIPICQRLLESYSFIVHFSVTFMPDMYKIKCCL